MNSYMNEAAALPPTVQANQLQEETRRYSKEEWEAQRPIIEGMYPLKGITLSSIASFLEQERGFIAT